MAAGELSEGPSEDSEGALSRSDSQNSSAANNNNEGEGAARTELAVVFLLDSSGSVGDGERVVKQSGVVGGCVM